MALTALAYTFLETERQRASADSLLSIGAVREAVTEVIVFMLFALGEQFATRAAAFIRDPPKKILALSRLGISRGPVTK